MFNHLSKFTCTDGVPDESQIEEWVDTYFHNLLTLFNSFLSKVDVNEAVVRMEAIPFNQLVAEELEGESPQIIEIAVKRVIEMAEIELEFMRSYLQPDEA